MIEVEQKFRASKGQLDKLIKNAEFIKEMVFTDIYYDTVDYALSKDDIWLRQRDQAWELKMPLDGVVKDFVTDHYEELMDEKSIRNFLQIDGQNDLVHDLLEYNYRPFCKLETTRRKYRQGDFNIDVDLVRGDNFNYAILEVELLVDKVEQIDIAKNKILTWARANDLEVQSVYGKVIAYLQITKPQHFQALVSAGTVKIN